MARIATTLIRPKRPERWNRTEVIKELWSLDELIASRDPGQVSEHIDNLVPNL
jgi:hypothetical protein